MSELLFLLNYVTYINVCIVIGILTFCDDNVDVDADDVDDMVMVIIILMITTGIKMRLKHFVMHISIFYRATICEGGTGSRNSVRLSACLSVRLSVCLSVCHTRGL